jgi:hypothetical protein
MNAKRRALYALEHPNCKPYKEKIKVVRKKEVCEKENVLPLKNTQERKVVSRKLIVRFDRQEDVDSFFALIKQKLTPKTGSIKFT